MIECPSCEQPNPNGTYGHRCNYCRVIMEEPAKKPAKKAAPEKAAKKPAKKAAPEKAAKKPAKKAAK